MECENGKRSVDPELIAKYFKYCRQNLEIHRQRKLDFERIAYQTFYNQNRKIFNKLSEICEKYSINYKKYIDFSIIDQKKYEPIELLSVDNIVLYSNKLREDEQYKNIYTYFLKSANNIADECIRLNVEPTEYLRNLISENRLAYEYFSGRISKYYLASIQNFKDAYQRLDSINKEELSIIYEAADELNCALQDAFMRFKKQRVKPIRFTKLLIEKKKLNKEITKQTK